MLITKSVAYERKMKGYLVCSLRRLFLLISTERTNLKEFFYMSGVRKMPKENED